MNLKNLQLNGMELVDPNADYSGDQVIYLDFKGANDVTYNNDALNIHVNGIDVADSGLDQASINQVITELNTTYAGSGVTFTVTPPDSSLLTLNHSPVQYSTVYVGSTGSTLTQYGNILGLSETIDAGDKIKNDNAFVFSDKINSTDQLAATVAHEAGHLLGYEHKEINQTSTPVGNSLADFAASLNLGSSYGVTIITHGFNGDAGNKSWLYGMAKAVQENIVDGYSLENKDAPIYKIAVTALIEDGISPLTVRLTEYSSGNEVTWDSIKATHPIIILDWTDVDGWPLLYSTQQIASVVTTALLNNNNNLLSAPIHLIGHSRGGSLIGSLAEDLGQKGIWVDQTTFLDPHPTMNANPFNNDWGQNTGLTVPWNVVFADNYYQDNGIPSSWPNGEDVNGATSIELQDPVLYNGSATEGYGMFGGGAHSDVHLWYQGTIPKDISDGFSDGEETITGTGTEASTWYLSGNFVATSVDVAFDRETMGYYYSLVEGGTRPGSGLSTSFGGDVVRKGAIESNNGWANIGYITNNDIGKTSYTVKDTLNMSYYYDSYNDSNATISFFLDDDCNPYNNDNNNKVTSIGDPFSVSFSGATKRENSLSFTSNNVGQNQYVLAKISTTIGNVRYSYMPGTIDIANNLIPNTILNNGNTQQIYFGQLAVNTTINSGGSQLISSGGMATNTTINSSGGQTVSSGGMAKYTTINSGGNQYVSSGGVANSTTISSGSQTILSDGVANSTTIFGNAFYVGQYWYFGIGSQAISSGGVANFTNLNSGRQAVSSGGVANYTTINSCGWQLISSGGVVNSTIINDCGVQNVCSGGVANYTTINHGTFMGAGVANFTTINFYGQQFISSGGMANSTTINSSGLQYLNGGVANSTTINSGGLQYVNVGGTANFTNIVGGSQGVGISGVANNTTINSGGSQGVGISGVANNTTINSGGWQTVYSGGVAISTIISAGSQLVGGVANNTIINYYGKQYIYGGGVASNTTLNNECSQFISSGGVANFTNINCGGWQEVGGVANPTTINSGGVQDISSGGAANSTNINSGGSQWVSSGGMANSTTINSGGAQVMFGMANFTTINSGGEQRIWDNGGVANSTIIRSGGSMDISGSANMINQQAGAAIIADTGATITDGTNARTDGHSNFSIINGIASNFLLENGGRLYGNAVDTVIASGGTQDAGIVDSTIINSLGEQYVGFYGVANNTIINGGIQYLYGTTDIIDQASGVANYTTINEDGSQTISSGGVANYTIINARGKQYISSCGAASNTTINGGGSQTISSGGVANSTTIDWGDQYILSGAVANYITILFGGIQYGEAGGMANYTTINSGGFQNFAGTASNTTIKSGGLMGVGGSANMIDQQSGAAIGTFTSATITSGINTRNDGHSAFCIVNGVASNFLLEYRGGLTVLSGHSAMDTVIASQGWLTVSSGGYANVINQQAGGTICTNTGATITNGTNTRADGRSAFSIVEGIASNFLLENGILDVLSGHSAMNTLIAGGMQNISSGGVANSTTINSGAQYVSSGGVATSTTINSGGWQSVCSGGVATSTTINSGGGQDVRRSGAVSNTIINLGGIQSVDGIAKSTNINSGGRQWVSAGGIASNTTVNAGGSMYVSGGIASGTLMIAGGHVTVEYADSILNLLPAEIGFKLANAQTNDTLLRIQSGTADYASHTTFTLDVNNTATGSYILTAGADLSVISSKIFSVTDNSQTIDVTVGYSYVFSNGDKLSLNYSDAAIDQLTATFTVDIVPPSTPSGLTRTITGNSAFFDWNDATDADSGVKQYEFQVDNNSDFSSNEKSGISATSNATATGLADGNYFWRVRTQDNSGNYSAWTNGSNFMVDVTAPSAPASLTPVVTGNNVVLNWSDSTDTTSGVKNYLLQYASNNQFAGAIQNSISASDASISGLSDGVYYWRVQAVDNIGNTSDWVNGTSFSVDTVAPTTPATLTRTITGNNVTFDWADATDATSGVKQYEIQVDNNSNFSSPESDTLPKTSNSSVNSLADGTYYWRVKTQDNIGNWSNWTIGESFIVDITAPTTPSGLTRTINGNNVDLDWNDALDATSGVKQYEFQVDNNSDFLSNEKSGTAAVSNTNVTSLADGNYFWKVRTVDNSGNYSAWTSGSSFTVDTTAPSVPAALTKTVTGSSVALDWADATDNLSGVKQYEYQVDNNSDFSSNEKSGIVVSSNANATGLADGTYFWKVRTQDNSGNYSAWSSGNNFMVDINAPSVPVSLTPVVSGNNVALDWADSTDSPSGVKQYQVQLDKHADFSSPEYSATTTNSTANFIGLADGTFYWRVNTQDNAGNTSAWSNGTSFVSDVGGTISGALLLSSPSTTGWVGTGDAADYYKITMTNAGMLTLGLTGLTGNADLSLLDAKNTGLKSSAKAGTADEAIVGVPLQAGDYYVKVAPGFGVKDANYTLTHTEKYCPVDTAANTWQTAKNINDGMDTWVGFGDTADFYKLTMTNAGTLSLNLTGLTGNADLSLLNSAGTALKTSANAGTANEAINNVLLLAGTYYVKVAAGTGVNDVNYNLSNTIKYCPTDKAANDYKTAFDISTLDNWVGFGDAADFYKLTMTNAGFLSLGLTGLTGNADLSLLNSAGTAIKTSANTGITNEAINNIALLAGTYYVKVAAGFGVNDASYTLTHTEKYTPVDTGANTWQTAKNIDDGVDNWVGFGDVADFYKLTMTNAGMLTLGLTGLTGNADLSLLSATGGVLKTSSNAGIASEAINNVALLAGTYYVKVAAGTSVNDASYNLSNTIKYTPADKAANDYKTAQDIANLDNWVGFGDTADFYKLTMNNAGTLSLNLTGLTGNADLSLLNSAGTAIKTSANTGITSEAITGVSLLAGTYYVKVAAGYGVNDASYNLTNTVSYFPCDTYDKAGNTIATAKLVDAPTQTGWVGFGDTDDYYRFDLATAAIGTLRLHDMIGGNADLTLYNAKGIQLKKSANLGVLEDTITSTLAAGTYYARVNAVSGNIDYKLDFSKKDGYGMLAS